MTEVVLRIRDLTTRFFTQQGQVNAVERVSLDVHSGEILGIVGESGSGKSVTAHSLIDLVDDPGRVVDGEIWFRAPAVADAVRDRRPEAVDDGFVDILRLSERHRRSLRGPYFATIFQDPAKSFNPSLTVGEQVSEAVEVQRRAAANPRSVAAKTSEYGLVNFIAGGVLPGRGFITEESRERAIDLLELVGIPDPAKRAREYPHEYSGGMLQRAMIAQALAGQPDVLIADEPTTALDVTIQAQILDLLGELQEETNLTVLLITHNLGVIARLCDRVAVMYAGEIVERGTLEDVFERPIHPYTEGLLGSVPDLDRTMETLQPIPGNVPSLLDHEMEDRCYFADRCPRAMTHCLDKPPELQADGSEEHAAKCVLAERPFDPADALPADYFTEHPPAE